jgi:DNA-directed RNA polymerase subunit RPC12/RpoP
VSLRKPGPGESLSERYPAVAAEWHPDLNGELTPADVKPGSNQKVWWRCSSCRYEWRAVIENRATGASRCPVCSRRLVRETRTAPGPGESLAEVDPPLAAEWHPDKNRPLTPADVRSNRSLKVWWRCSSCGHEWRAMIRERAIGHGCFKCAARRRAAKRAFVPRRKGRRLPDHLLAEWRPDLNDCDPSTLTGGSDYRAWWRCSTCGHEWQASVFNRVAHGSGCPPCGHRRTAEAASRPAPGQSLADLYPELTAEWDIGRNGNLTPADVRPGSQHGVWWLCSTCGLSYSATPTSRTSRRSGCRLCVARKWAQKLHVPSEGRSLADVLPDVAAEWHPIRNDPLRPEDVKPWSNRMAWWRCREGHEWRTTVAQRARGRRCPHCLLWGTSAQQIRLAAELIALGLPVSAGHRPIEVTGRRPVRGDVVLAGWRVVIELDGEFWHTNQVARDQAQTKALTGVGWHVLRLREGNLPKLGAGEMHVSVPTYADGHTLACAAVDGLAHLGYDTPGIENYRAVGQPIATEQADTDIYSLRDVSLASEFPDVAAEWHRVRNTTTPARVAPFANTKAWWICAACGHEWQALIFNRTLHGQGCPVCGRKRADIARATPRPGRSLADRLPEVAAIWHPTKNGQVTPADINSGSNTERWWLCPSCGKDFLSTPHNRKKARPLCPRCSKSHPHKNRS